MQTHVMYCVPCITAICKWVAWIKERAQADLAGHRTTDLNIFAGQGTSLLSNRAFSERSCIKLPY